MNYTKIPSKNKTLINLDCNSSNFFLINSERPKEDNILSEIPWIVVKHYKSREGYNVSLVLSKGI